MSDNVLTLSGFNFDANSGWTGKGLKFDGVNDIISTLNFSAKTIVLKCEVESKKGSAFYIFDERKNEEDTFAGRIWSTANTETLTQQNAVLYYDDKYTSLPTVVLGVKTFSFESRSVINIFKRYSPSSGNLENAKGIIHSIKIYNVALTPEEIAQNYEYEQSIDRTTISTYPLLQEQKSYGIGLTNQLSDEQKSTFRLSVDGTKFVAGLRYCEGLEVEEFTYSEIQVEMEKEEWSKIEELE